MRIDINALNDKQAQVIRSAKEDDFASSENEVTVEDLRSYLNDLIADPKTSDAHAGEVEETLIYLEENNITSITL